MRTHSFFFPCPLFFLSLSLSLCCSLSTCVFLYSFSVNERYASLARARALCACGPGVASRALGVARPTRPSGVPYRGTNSSCLGAIRVNSLCACAVRLFFYYLNHDLLKMLSRGNSAERVRRALQPLRGGPTRRNRQPVGCKRRDFLRKRQVESAIQAVKESTEQKRKQRTQTNNQTNKHTHTHTDAHTSIAIASRSSRLLRCDAYPYQNTTGRSTSAYQTTELLRLLRTTACIGISSMSRLLRPLRLGRAAHHA